jgi:hypothetical protein
MENYGQFKWEVTQFLEIDWINNVYLLGYSLSSYKLFMIYLTNLHFAIENYIIQYLFIRCLLSGHQCI